MLVKSQKFEIFKVGNRNITSLTIISEKRRIPMKKATIFFAFLLFVSANAILLWFINAAESNDYVQPPIELRAKDFLPQDLLQGENYRVEDEVKSDGLINTYQLSTNYGLLTVESTAELLIRINELRALVIMEEMDRKKVFGDALVSGVKGTVKGATAGGKMMPSSSWFCSMAEATVLLTPMP